MLIEKVFDPEKDIETWVVAAVESLVAAPSAPSKADDAVDKPAEAAPEEKKESEEVANEGGEPEQAAAETAQEEQPLKTDE